MGLGKRADMNGSPRRRREWGPGGGYPENRDSMLLRGHRVIGGLQTDLHVRRDGTFLALGASWYQSSQLKAYAITAIDDIDGPLWNQKQLTPDAALAEPAKSRDGCRWYLRRQRYHPRRISNRHPGGSGCTIRPLVTVI